MDAEVVPGAGQICNTILRLTSRMLFLALKQKYVSHVWKAARNAMVVEQPKVVAQSCAANAAAVARFNFSKVSSQSVGLVQDVEEQVKS